jgi:hypothetical protein
MSTKEKSNDTECGRTTAGSMMTTTTSMNIVTFATPVSVKPKKLWIISLYHGTRTKDAFFAQQQQQRQQQLPEQQSPAVAVLQLLKPQHKHLVPILGKRSGYEAGYSKAAACAAQAIANVDDASSTRNSHTEGKQSFAWVTNNIHSPLPTGDKNVNNDSVSSSKTGTSPACVFAPGIALLPDCATYIQLELLSSSSSSSSPLSYSSSSLAGSASASSSTSTLDAGDHIVALCQVTATGRWDEAQQRVVTNNLVNDNEPLLKLDPNTVLYTGLLRDEGII